jgi:hypothetical protein
MKKNLTKEEKEVKIVDLVVGEINDAFKKYHVDKQHKNIIIDRGGIYLSDKKKGDGSKTFLIVSWITKRTFREMVFKFDDYDGAYTAAVVIASTYENCRLSQAIK